MPNARRSGLVNVHVNVLVHGTGASEQKTPGFVVVIEGYSPYKNMKDLLESSRKLRSDISRSVKRGRTCDDFLASPVADPYRSYANLYSFAAQLFAEDE